MIQIPLRNDLDYYEFTIALGGVDYNFTFDWNDRLERWCFDISDATGSPIVQGVDVIVNWLVLGRFRDSRLPKGDLIFGNQDGTDTDPGLSDLGGNCQLYYVEPSDEV